jgi:hypothetical protein
MTRQSACPACEADVQPYFTEPGDEGCERAYYRCRTCGQRWQATWDGEAHHLVSLTAGDLAPIERDGIQTITPRRAALNRAILRAEVRAYGRGAA